MNGVMERLERQAADAEQRASRLRKMVELAQEVGDEGLAELAELLHGAPGTSAHNGKGNGNGYATGAAEKAPRGREAVRQVVADKPGVWTLSKIVAELQRREWFTSRKGAEVAVSRMIADGEGRRVRKGVYEFPANRPEAVMFP